MTPTSHPNRSAAYGLTTFAVLVFVADAIGISFWLAAGFLVLAAIAYGQSMKKET